MTRYHPHMFQGWMSPIPLPDLELKRYPENKHNPFLDSKKILDFPLVNLTKAEYIEIS